MISTQTAASLTSMTWDAVIIGAGPAGSAIAAQLKRSLKRVLLVDRRTLPFHKLCGCCLSPQATTELDTLGVDLSSGGRPPDQLTRCTFRSSGIALQLNLSQMAVISRERLDAQLIEHAMNCDVDFQGSTTIKKVEWDQNTKLRLLHAELLPSHRGDPVTIRSHAVVDASGLPSTPRAKAAQRFFAPRIGLGAVLRDDQFPLERGHLKMLIAPGGYCGLVRLENNCIDIAAALDVSSMHGRPPWQGVDAIFKHNSCDPPVGLPRATFIGKPALTRRSTLYDQRCYRVGDAAGYVEPLTGEGIGWALRGARELAAAFEQVDPKQPDATQQIGRRYSRGYWAALQRDFRRCRLLTLAVRNRHLWNLTMKASRHAPALIHRIFPQATLHTDSHEDQDASPRQKVEEL